MSTCGMYDFAGEWLYRVGLPAKSGVSGGIAAVQPGRLGFGANSPLLDGRGNSVRGIAAYEMLSQRLDLHLFAPNGGDHGRLRPPARGDAVRSMRVRLTRETDVLNTHGARIVVRVLAGVQDAASSERIIRAVLADAEVGWVVFDLRRVTHAEPAAVGLLARLLEQLRAAAVYVVVVPPRVLAARRATQSLGVAATMEIADADDALRWCEDALLAAHGVTAGPADSLVALPDQDLLAGVSAHTIAALEAARVTRVFAAGSPVFAEGVAADALYFIGAGQVSAGISSGGKFRRLSTMGPGSCFGELGLVDGQPRSAAVVADDATLCHVLTVHAFEALVTADPLAGAELHRAIARTLATRLRQATKEIRVVDQRD